MTDFFFSRQLCFPFKFLCVCVSYFRTLLWSCFMLVVSIQLGLYLLLVISSPCIRLPGLFEQCSTNWVAYNVRTLLSHSSGDYRSELRVWAGLAPPGGTEENVSHASLLPFSSCQPPSCSLAVVTWLSLAICLCLCIQITFFLCGHHTSE